MSNFTTLLIALLGGVFLGLMVYFNGLMANAIGAVPGSAIIHIVGLGTSLFLVVFSFKTVKRRNYIFHWTHIAGAFGGVAVAIIGYAVNSKIGLAPTMGAVVIGQILYGWLSDSFGFFGSPIKKVSSLDILQVLFILTGVGVLIYA